MNANHQSTEIVKTIEVNAPQAHVFETFVSRIADWWPLEKFARSRNQKPQTVVIEAFVGGLIYEKAETGETLSWGSVKTIQPHSRLVMEWHLGRPVSTEVEVEFEVLSESKTLVRLTHRGWEKLEAIGATVERTGYEQGWAMIFEKNFKIAATIGKAN
jgi:uncharacterized protein YndB with AHSA1/START domain